jgi:hypothetical protein
MQPSNVQILFFFYNEKITYSCINSSFTLQISKWNKLFEN